MNNQNNSEHLFSLYSVPGTVLVALHHYSLYS